MSDARARTTALVFWGGLVVALVVVAVAITGDINREPLDPRSVAPEGARALVEVAERAGAEVDIGIEIPGSGAEVAVLLADTYGVAGRDELEDWVRSGGRLLVADTGSPLTPAVGVPSAALGVGGCSVPALAGVRRLVGLDRAYVTDGPDGTACFGGGVVVRALGDGVIVSVGGPGPLLNERLAEADNAVLAVSILAPRPGTQVAFLEPRLAVAAGENLEDLVGDPVWLLLIQLAVGFVVIALWQARRLGRPVVEPVPVEIAGSELAAARGRLLAGLRNPGAAAGELRDDAHRALTRALGVGADTDPAVVAAQIAQRTGVEQSRIQSLFASPAATDADLLAVAAGLADLTALVDPIRAGGPRPAPTEPGSTDAAPPDSTPTTGASDDAPVATDPRSHR